MQSMSHTNPLKSAQEHKRQYAAAGIESCAENDGGFACGLSIHTINILECNVLKIIGGCVRSGPNFAAALLRSARLGGNTAMLLRAVLSAQADRVSAALGTRSGVEMRAGRRAAERAGAQIVLGEGCPLV
jgi:hypothetical protein